MDTNNDRINTIKNYLNYLEKGEEERILDLFGETAMVTSPRTGRVSATQFYGGLFDSLKQSAITQIEIFKSTETPDTFAAYFHYNWELQDGSKAGLVCADIVKFQSGSNLITELKVVAYPIQG